MILTDEQKENSTPYNQNQPAGWQVRRVIK